MSEAPKAGEGKEKPKIKIAPAIKIGRVIYRGYTHHEIAEKVARERSPQKFGNDLDKEIARIRMIHKNDEGFATSDGAFYSRKEAADFLKQRGLVNSGVDELDAGDLVFDIFDSESIKNDKRD